MNYIKFIALFAGLSFAFLSCSNDDEVTQEDQNNLDNQAIANLLSDYYLDPVRGRVLPFDPDDEEDDAFPSLQSLAVQDPSGYWYIINPNVTPEGPQLTNNATDSILITYDLRQFRATTEAENGFGGLVAFRNTINTTGTPVWDPNFYFSGLTEAQISETQRPEFFEIEGIVDGLTKFRATNSDFAEGFTFQGVIIVPSRLAFARDVNLQNVPRDISFVLMFEVHKVVPRS